MRKLDYWPNLSHAINYSDRSAQMTEVFDPLEVIMIERNFNSPLFVKYLTSKFSDALEINHILPQIAHNLAFLQITFDQNSCNEKRDF